MPKLTHAARLLCIAFLAVVASCGTPRELTANDLSVLISEETGRYGAMHEQEIFVKSEDGAFRSEIVYIIERSNGGTVVMDRQGERYEPTLADFQADNHLFADTDHITVPKDFPATSRGGDLELITVPGHTSTSWWLIGGIAATVLVVIAAGTRYWRRQSIPTRYSDLD